MSLVLRSDSDGATTLTLNRPEKLNAVTGNMMSELRTHLDEVAADETVRCVILTGAGKSFCAGHDISEVTAEEPSDGSPEAIDALECLPQPTIAKVKGHCMTGGLELALGCDLIVAGDSATFADTHGHWGLVPAWGLSIRLPERVGLTSAKLLMFTSDRIGAVRALALGLVCEVVADDQLDEAVEQLVQRICANSPWANRIVKRLLADGAGKSRRESLGYERSLPYGLPRDMEERLAGWV